MTSIEGHRPDGGASAASRLRQDESEAERRVRHQAEELMRHHGLTGWSFGFDNAKRRLGCCHWDNRRITLSRWHVEHHAADEVQDTLLHEIAHALCHRGEGHGHAWKAKAIEVGARPERCKSLGGPPRAWRGTCEVCGASSLTHRRADVSCGECSPGKYDNRFLIRYTRVGGGAK